MRINNTIKLDKQFKLAILYFYFILILLFNANLFSQQLDTLWTKKIINHPNWTGTHLIQETEDKGFVIIGNEFYERNTLVINQITFIKTDKFGNVQFLKYLNEGEEKCHSAKMTSDGGYIITGESGWKYGYAVLIIRTDYEGNVLWLKSINRGDKEEAGYCVQETDDGGFIIVGDTQSSTFGNRDVYLIKTDNAGNVEWEKTYGGYDYDGGTYVVQTTDGGFLITGHTRSFGSGYHDVFIIKTDKDGETLWTKTIGGSGWEMGNIISSTSEGDFIIAGTTDSYGNGKFDYYFIKIDNLGNLLFSKTYGDSRNNILRSMIKSLDNGYILVGIRRIIMESLIVDDEPYSHWDVYIVITDQYGNEKQSLSFGSIDYESIQSINYTTDGSYILGGYFCNDITNERSIYLVKLGKPQNEIPIADAGPDQTVIVGETVMFDGSSSYDQDGDALTYEWELICYPTGSLAELSDPNSVNSTFVADLPGDYVVQLIVNDGTENSDPDQITITVLTYQESGQELINEVMTLVEQNELNKGLGNALIVKMENYINKLDQGKVKTAANILKSFINQVSELISEDKLTLEQGHEMIDWASRIIRIIENGLGKKMVEHTESISIPTEYGLNQNYPNPFNPETTIRYALPEQAHVNIEIYNIASEKVTTLINNYENAGYHTVRWNGMDDLDSIVSCGIYLCRIQAGSYQQTIRMLLLK